MSEQDAIDESERSGPIRPSRLRGDLERLGLRPGALVLMHSSLSSLGWVPGAAQGAVEAVRGALGAEGTLVVPTFSSQLSDPALWMAPPVPTDWVPVLREHLPAFDPRLTATRGMGAIPECLRSHEDSLRSAHPLYSFAAVGPLSEALLAPHMLEAALGEESPLGRLYAHGAQILLLGVGFDSCTGLHLSEHRASWPGKKTLRQGAPLRGEDGHRRWMFFDELDYDEEDFSELGRAYIRAQAGPVRRGKVGLAEATLLPMQALVDFGVDWIERHRRA